MSDTWLTPEYWLQLAPQLHIQDDQLLLHASAFEVQQSLGRTLNELIVREGYFQIDPPNWGLPLRAMAQAILTLEQHGWLSVFAFLYDEYWLLYHRLKDVVAAVLGEEFKIRPDFWAWHVNPSKGESGWPPHRDWDLDGLFPDGRPKTLTIWIPLTDATPLNGCMYVVPADRDPTYGTASRDFWRFQQVDIRALPAAAGSVLCWNSEVIHWGSHSTPRAPQPRISLALEFQRGDVPPFNEPLMPNGTVPPFPLRLQLIGKQMFQWSARYPLAPEMVSFARRLLGEA